MERKHNNERVEFIDDHPILRDAAIIPTRPLEEFVNAILVWLDKLLPGGLVWGNQRVGKTQAIRYIVDNCEEVLGSPIPTTMLSMWQPSQSSTTELRFFDEMLQALNYSLIDSKAARIKRRRCIDFMVERAFQTREHRYLLFIDEAEWLDLTQYEYLMDLHNSLKMKDVRLVTVLVGQPELIDIKNNFRSSGKQQLLGRFMTATHRFEGIADKRDFRRIIKMLDSHSEYPPGSGCSYTRYFAPQAYDAGWRLLDSAELIWDSLMEMCRAEHIAKFDEIPLQPISALLRWILKALPEQDDMSLQLEKRFIEDAISHVAIEQIKDLVVRTAH